MKKHPINQGIDFTVIRVIAYVIVTFFAIICFLPFLMLISTSFTAEKTIVQDGFSLFPRALTLDAYKYLFRFPETIFSAYQVSITVTVLGTIISVFLCAMTGYVLQRKDFKYRNKISFIIYFTSLFSVGMIPQYLLVTQVLGLTDNLLALILPPLLNPFLIILMRTFIKSAIPDSLIESAKIDGVNEFRIFLSIVMPLSTAGLATVGLFTALMYWNDWFYGMLYIRTPVKYPLQFYLYNMFMKAQAIREMANVEMGSNVELPTESIKMATAVVTTGPILILYPLVQKYFVTGLTIGAVKG
jgi:putative aldouronate transport system permease protein